MVNWGTSNLPAATKPSCCCPVCGACLGTACCCPTPECKYCRGTHATLQREDFDLLYDQWPARHPDLSQPTRCLIGGGIYGRGAAGGNG